MSKVPLDVVNDTLYRLPAKTLLRHRGLSKLHCSIIDNPSFVKQHLKHSVSIKSRRSLILKGLHLYTVDFDSLDTATPFDMYTESIWSGTEVFGSCDGLIGLSNSEKDICLLNPSTRKLFKLPVAEIDFPSEPCIRGFVFYGFGRDLVNDDYKVVRMVQFRSDEHDELGCSYDYEVRVYGLKTNSWKKAKNLPRYLRFLFQFYYHLLHRRGYGVFAGGSLHWVLPRTPDLNANSAIIAFNLATDEFSPLPQPHYGDSDKDFMLDVGALEGCLCVICNYSEVRVDVWIMKEYGVKESWTKLFSVEPSRTVSSLSYLKPLTYLGDDTGDEKILLEVNSNKIVWYDMKTKKLKRVKIDGCPNSYGADICVESLISPGDHKTEKQKQLEEDKKKENTKKRYIPCPCLCVRSACDVLLVIVVYTFLILEIYYCSVKIGILLG